MTVKTLMGLCFATITALALSAFAPSQKLPTQIDIRRVMTVSDFKSAGLDKLTSDELDALNRWLTKFALQTTASGAAAAVSTPIIGGCSRAIESQIEGTFNGWNGDTVFKLTNGEIWQQASYAYTYHYAYRPEVTIYAASGGCKMRVEDVDETITVKRIK